MIDPGMEAMLETFIHETETMLEQLDEILMDSEREKTISEDNINSIFRITHTIKGSAAMMDFEGISSLAHSVEDVFYIIREAPEKLGLVFDNIFDLLFQASDFFKQELEKLQGDEYDPADPADMISKLESEAAILKGEDAPSQPAEASSEPDGGAQEEYAAADGKKKLRIRVFFEDNCQMENMRAFMLLTQLHNCCEFLDSIPKNPESSAALSSEIIEHGFTIICVPANATSDITSIIESALNIKSYEILDDSGDDRPEADAEKADGAGSADEKAGGPQAAKTKTDGAASAPKAEAKQHVGGAKQSLISVNQSKLDLLMDLVGEIVTAESMVVRNPDLVGLKLDNFTKSMRELRKLTDELQDTVMSMRMVPLHSTFLKMERIVRDMSKKLDKKAELVTIGGETEVDKTINDAIADPFMHMIRNSMDHGIEPAEERAETGKPEVGKITLAAKNVGGEIIIEISDDGQGLDAAKLLEKARNNGLLTKPESEYTEKEAFQLIMLPGFSTNKEVTEYSGRGVGMDVVRKNIEQVGGMLSIHSVKGEGTTFTIKIPLTLAIVDGMNLAVGDSVFTLPINSITQSFKLYDESAVIKNTDGSEMTMIRGECMPIIRLSSLYGIDSKVDSFCDGILIQIESNGKSACLFADELLGEYQVVVKPFPPFFNKYNLKQCGLSGCSILGDGTISLILDANTLLS